jgi:hypothetical protein
MPQVRNQILWQTEIFKPADLIPVPCNPDALIMGYVLKAGDCYFPFTHLIDPEVLLNNSKNTIVYEQDEKLHAHVLNMFSTGQAVDSVKEELHHLLCCLPEVSAPAFLTTIFSGLSS